MLKINYKPMSLLCALALIGCGGGSGSSDTPTPTPSPGVEPSMKLMTDTSQSYMSDSDVILSLELKVEDVNNLHLKSAAVNESLKVLKREVVSQSPDSAVKLQLMDAINSCQLNELMAMGDKCTDQWQVNTSKETDEFEGKIIYTTNMGNAEVDVKLVFKSPHDPEFNMDKFTISAITPIGTGMTSHVTIDNATQRSINNPELIFPEVIRDHVVDLTSVAEVKSGESVQISFAIEDSQAALDALKNWQQQMTQNESLLEYKSARFPEDKHLQKPQIYTQDLQLSTSSLYTFNAVDGQYQAVVSLLNISGADITAINHKISDDTNDITIDLANCQFPLAHDNSCLAVVNIKPQIAKRNQLDQTFDIELRAVDVTYRDPANLSVQLNNTVELAITEKSTLLAGYDNQIAIENKTLLHWLPSNEIVDYHIVDIDGNDMSSRFVLSDALKQPSCLSALSVAKGDHCYLTVKARFDETGKQYFLSLSNSNYVSQDTLELPVYTDNGIQPSQLLNPETAIKDRAASLYFTIATPDEKIFNGFELVGVLGASQDTSVSNSCEIGMPVSVDKPCQLKLDIPENQISSDPFDPELIIKWADGTQTQSNIININVVDPTASGEDISDLPDIVNLAAQTSYVDINPDSLTLYIKNMTGKVLMNIKPQITAGWLADLFEISAFDHLGSLAVNQSLAVSLPLKSGVSAVELDQALKAHMTELVNNADLSDQGGKVIEITAANAVDHYRPNIVLDTFPYIHTDDNEKSMQSISHIMQFGKPGIENLIINNPTATDYTIDFSESLPLGVTRLLNGGYNGVANCSQISTLSAGASCALRMQASVDATEGVGDHVDVILSSENASIPDTTLHVTFATNYIYKVGYVPAQSAIEIPVTGNRSYNLALTNNEPDMQWQPSNNPSDYVLSHVAGIEALRIVAPTTTPSCLSHLAVASGEACYIGLEVSDNATPQSDYQLSLNMGLSNLAIDGVVAGQINIVDHGMVSVNVQKDGQTMSSAAPSEVFDIVINAPENWREYVSTDQSYEVDLSDAPMQFVSGNSCTLSYNGTDNSCYISIEVSDEAQTSEYILHIDPIVGTTLPIAQGESIKRVLTRLFRFHSVSFGSRHACAMDDNAMPYCWGSPYRGVLGYDNGNEHDSYAPPLAPAKVKLPEGVHTIQLVTGGSNTCLLDMNGDVYCWGSNTRGQIDASDQADSYFTSPIKVDLPEKMERIFSLGEDRVCALSINGHSYCWGNGSRGEMGNNTEKHKNAPSLVSVPLGVKFIDIKLGLKSVFALGDNNKLYGWGDFNGESKSLIPREIAMPNDITIEKIGTGDYHRCFLADNSKVYCWGSVISSSIFLLGSDRSAAPSNDPVEVVLPEHARVLDFTVVKMTSCALTHNNEIYCWGNNGDGQLGNGADTSERPPFPVKVLLPQNREFIEIIGSEYTFCAIASNNDHFCWGDNRYGQIAEGSSHEINIPVQLFP